MPFAHARLCNAHKRDGTTCQQPAMTGKTKCRMHGGKSLAGMANGNYRTGRYSRLIPARLAQRYEAARTNTRLLSLQDDLAMCEARLGDLFQRVDSGESGAVWGALDTALDAFNKAMAQNDLPAMHVHLATLRRLITQGHNDFACWREIQSLWETRAKLTMTEVKTLQTAQQMISAEQLMIYLGVVTDAITRCVTAHAEPDVARAILGSLSTEFNQLTLLEARRGA